MAPPTFEETAEPPPLDVQRTSSRTKKRPPGQDKRSNLPPESPHCSKKARTAAPRALKRKVPHVSKHSNDLDRQLHAKSVECVHALSHLAATALAARESLLWLDSHPTSRNLLMAVSPTKVPAYTTEQVLQAHVGPHTQDGFIPHRSVNDAKESVFEFTPIRESSPPFRKHFSVCEWPIVPRPVPTARQFISADESCRRLPRDWTHEGIEERMP
jgi:hypothetical protein